MAIKALESPVVLVAAPAGAPLAVTGDLAVEEPGPSLQLWSGEIPTTPGTSQALLAAAVPVGKTWRLRHVEVVSRAYGAFVVKKAGVAVKGGKTGPAEPTVSLPFHPYEIVAAGQVVALDFLQTQGAAVPVEARIYYTET